MSLALSDVESPTRVDRTLFCRWLVAAVDEVVECLLGVPRAVPRWLMLSDGAGELLRCTSAAELCCWPPRTDMT